MQGLNGLETNGVVHRAYTSAKRGEVTLACPTRLRDYLASGTQTDRSSKAVT
jgi:hypothetical protein